MAEDLSVFFSDPLFSVAVVFGDINTRGILDMPDVISQQGLVESTAFSLLVTTSDFPTAPVLGDLITVDGNDYVVNSTTKVDDGRLSRISLSEVDQ